MVFIYILEKGVQIDIAGKFNDYLDLFYLKSGTNKKHEFETCENKIADRYMQQKELKDLDLSKVYCLPQDFATDIFNSEANLIVNKCDPEVRKTCMNDKYQSFLRLWLSSLTFVTGVTQDVLVMDSYDHQKYSFVPEVRLTNKMMLYMDKHVS